MESLAIAADLAERYRRDGVVKLPGVLDETWRETVLAGIERNLRAPGPMFLDYSTDGSPGAYANDFWTWREIPEFRRLIFDSPLAALAGRLMGTPSVTLYMDNWMIRRAGAVNRAPWHHDQPYFDVEGPMAVVWAPLEPLDAGDRLEFVAGSHRWGRLFQPVRFTDHAFKAPPAPPYEPMPSLETLRERGELIGFEVEPGDVLVFDGLTVHGAPEATPARRTNRRLTLRLVGEEARYRRRATWTRETADVLERQGLRDGDAFACDLLPVLWRRGDAVGPA